MTLRVPVSLKITVPLILLGFATALGAVNLLHHVPLAERAAEEGIRQRVAQEMSRLQSTLEYLLLKGEFAVAQREIAVLAHNHDYALVVLTDDRQAVIASTRRAWLGQPVAQVAAEFDPAQAAAAVRERQANLVVDRNGGALMGYAGILLGADREELRPSRTGNLFLVYDLVRSKREARAQVLRQSIDWAGWVAALAAVLWLTFHFLLTRRTARLVRAAERLAAGDLEARSGLGGHDELGRLSRAFDAMAGEVARTQTRLRASEEQYRSMFDASVDGLALLDAAGRIVQTNPALWRMIGFGTDESAALAARKSDRGAPDPLAFLHRVAGDQPRQVEVTEIRRDGSALELEIRGVPMRYQGEPHVLAIARDITDRKRAAVELERQREAFHQSERLAALGSLLAGVSHELNNPLSVVVARAVLLEEQSEPQTRIAAIKIRTAAERCARIVRTFLSMARQQSPERGPVLVNDVLADALEIAAYALRTSGIEVRRNLPRDIPPILADADQLHQVFLNLIINAQQSLQDSPAPRRITVTTGLVAATGQIRISVADNGPGIPEQLRARVFEPYFTTKPAGVGTGVGLAVSLGIVEAHGGTLTVDCPAGGGAIFAIALPVGDVSAPGVEAGLPEGKAAGRHAILIVDDEPELREALAEILESTTHRVTTAGSGREALERMAAERFDAILTDLRMPDIDGSSLYREIERRWPDLAERVVFVTGDTLASTLRDFVAESGRPVIEKPFLPAEVRQVVAGLFADGERGAATARSDR